MGEAGDAATVFRFGGFALDVGRRSLCRGDEPVELRPKSFDVLAFLVRTGGRAVAKDELLHAVWPGVVVTDESLTRCISDIRHALGDSDQRVIKTLLRHGYAFVAPLTPSGTDAAATAPAAKPKRGRFTLVAALLVAAALAGLAAWRLGAPPTVSAPVARLSIVVLPLTSRDGNPQQDYLAEALTEEITVDLSRIPDSFVIARSSAESYRGRGIDARQVGRELGVNYVLEGSLARQDEQLRLTLQLVDSASARMLWSETLDGRMNDLASLHQRVTGAVARSLQVRVMQAEAERAAQQRPVDRAAQDLALQAWSTMTGHYTPERIAAAREQLQQAVALDPNSANAWAWLADTYRLDIAARYWQRRGATREHWLKLAADAADRAYALDANSPRVLGARAWVLIFLGRSNDAVELLQHQLGLNRNDADAWHALSYAYATLGRHPESIAAGRESIRLSPRDARLIGFRLVIAAAYLHLGDDREALDWARRSVNARPDLPMPYAYVAAAAANLDEMDVARDALAEFRKRLPHYTIATLRDEKLCSSEACSRDRERYFAGLKKAGLPD